MKYSGVILNYRKLKAFYPGLLLGCFFVFGSASCFAQDAVMILNTQELGPHQRPAVHFSHEKHAESLECVRCHHDYDEFMNNTGGEGNRCADCHEKEPGDNPLSLIDAFHTQCMECHLEIDQRGLAENIPLACGECHLRARPGGGK
ncbi:cytochrome C [Dethiosulfatarculus sandiegensis]|uniref:Cytochrome C n=2 Tax=Dethiosulfatarculus sandiegensis TaxID=1429043 RepID=A0A0D2JHF2_9BACT|nr:cytochrome C [Dethiosulfatarculus sandiegensis]